jgi:hypothetical protein
VLKAKLPLSAIHYMVYSVHGFLSFTVTVTAIAAERSYFPSSPSPFLSSSHTSSSFSTLHPSLRGPHPLGAVQVPGEGSGSKEKMEGPDQTGQQQIKRDNNKSTLRNMKGQSVLYHNAVHNIPYRTIPYHTIPYTLPLPLIRPIYPQTL